MEEENFEKKSSKKTLKIVILVILLLLVIGVAIVFAFTQINAKPEKVFKEAVEEMFDDTEGNVEYKSAKMNMDMSASVKATSNADSEIASQVSMINYILNSVKLKLSMDIDLENKLLSGGIVAEYAGDNVISLDAIIQDEKMYLYLKDLYSKYIEIPADELEGLDLASLFEASSADTTSKELLDDIKQILNDKIEESEFEKETADIDIAGEEKSVNKASLTLSYKEFTKLSGDILEKIGEYQDNKDVKDMINEMLEEIDDMDESENVVVIDIYTEKLTNKIVRYDMTLVNNEDNEVIAIQATKLEDKTWEIALLLNEESTELSGATKLISLEIVEKSENEGSMSLTIYDEEDGLEITLKIDFTVEYNVEIEKRDIRKSNTINANDLTEEDAQEILENAEKNEILKAFIEGFIEGYTGVDSDDDYNFDDYDYDYDYDDYNYDDYDYNDYINSFYEYNYGNEVENVL